MKKLLILSGKGGTGKTSVTAAFVDFSGMDAIADCDVEAPNLHLVLEMNTDPKRSNYVGSQKPVIEASKCIGCGICEEKCRFNAILQADSHYVVDEYACESCGVCMHVCPVKAITMKDNVSGELTLYENEVRTFSTAKLKMGSGNSGKLVTEVKTTLEKAVPETQLAIIDGAPGIGCPVIASVSGVDLVLIVAEPSASGISDMKRIFKTTQRFQTKVAVCVNKYDLNVDNTSAIEAFCEENGVPFVGHIPYDSHVSAAINAGHSIAHTDCPASRALLKVYGNTMKLIEELFEI